MSAAGQRPTWTRTPDALLLDPVVSPLAKAVYGVLGTRGSTPDTCYPRHQWVAEQLGISPRSVARPLRELAAAGWITVVERLGSGGREANGYELHDRAAQRVLTAQHSAPPPRSTARTVKRLIEQEPEEPPSPPTPSEQVSLGVAESIETTEAKAERRFKRLWEAWPKRRDVRPRKAEAERFWRLHMTPTEHEAAWRAVSNYRECDAVKRGYGMALIHWLRERCWEQWQQPEERREEPRHESSLSHGQHRYPFNEPMSAS